MQFSSREMFTGVWRHQTRLEIFGALSAGSRVTIPARYVRTCRRQSCWPSWPFAVRPRFIAGRDLGSRPLVPNVGLVGFLLSATAASKGRERKARDVRCHKIASDPICFGPLYNGTQLFLGFMEIYTNIWTIIYYAS